MENDWPVNTPPTPIFAQLAAINCQEHVEKKGKFSYLSWPWAVKKLRETDPTATWSVLRFDGLPYLKTDFGVFVEVAVTVQGVTLSQIHPVLNANNRPIAEPDAFQINTSIQRCLVKAIALHGLGLYIYAGEDLPDEERLPKAELTPQSPTDIIREEFAALPEDVREELTLHASIVNAMHHKDKANAGPVMVAYLKEQNFSGDHKCALWSLLPSDVRSSIKRSEAKPELVTQA